MNEDKDTIAFLSNYLTELRKTHLNEKGRELVRTVEEILRKEIKLQTELKELRDNEKKNTIKSIQKARFYSNTPRSEKNETTIEELNKHKTLNQLLNLATALTIRDQKER